MNRKIYLSFILILVLTFCQNVLSGEYDFTIEVGAGQIQCYFQEVREDRHIMMEIDYQVIDGADLNINFLLTNPQSTLLIQDLRRTDHSHKIDVAQVKGDYQLCFDNTFSYQASKLVFFQIFLFDVNGSTEELEFGKLSPSHASAKLQELGITVDAFAASMGRIRSSLNKAEQYQSMLRAYEARDRAIMEANFERVNTWSIVNILVLVVVTSLQVYMIRSLFEDKSKVGKLLRHSNR